MAADQEPTHPHETSIVHRLLGDNVEITDVQVIGEHELSLIVGPDMLDQLFALLDRRTTSLYTPRRGTPEYREMLEHGAETSDMEALTQGINHIWHSYRWPGVVDFMDLLIRRICEYSNPLVQDADGVPQLSMIIRTGQDEADLMETAVAVSNEPEAAAHGYDFATSLELGKLLVSYIESWRPHFQDALRACTAGHPEEIRPILVRLPGLREEQERVLQGVLVLALATCAVSDPLTAARHLVAYGTPASDVLPYQISTKRPKRHK